MQYFSGTVYTYPQTNGVLTRLFSLLSSQLKQEALTARPTLRARKPVAGYARRSDHKSKDEEKDKTQSREMQTEDLREWAIDHGWKENDFHPYFADFGLSGTLRPDQRPDT